MLSATLKKCPRGEDYKEGARTEASASAAQMMRSARMAATHTCPL